MVEPAVVAKIRKLLKLAADPANAHEAALAAERAQELLFRHHLDMADVTAEADAFAELTEVDRPYIFLPWRKTLAALLCTYNFCTLLEWPGGTKFIGGPVEIETVLYLYAYLSRAIFKLSREAWDARVADFTDPILGRHPVLDEPDALTAEQVWKESFRIGAIEMIGIRLQRQRETQETLARYAARAPHEPGLVRATSALQAWDGLLARYVREKYGPVTEVENPEVGINIAGFTAGVQTGKSLPLSRGLQKGTSPRGIDG